MLLAAEDKTPHCTVTVRCELRKVDILGFLGEYSSDIATSTQVRDIDRVPLWDDNELTGIKTFREDDYIWYDELYTSPNDLPKVTVTRLDTGVSLTYQNGNASNIGFFDYADMGKKIPLKFYPPPTSYR